MKNLFPLLLIVPIATFLIGLYSGYLIGLSKPKHLSIQEFANIKKAIDGFCIKNGYYRGGYLVFNYTNTSTDVLVRCINISYVQRKDFRIEDVKLS